MRRVARDLVVIFTWDPEHPPSLHDIEKAIGPTEVHSVPIPSECTDGFLGAYWRRPEAYLNPRVRAAISTFSKFDSTTGVARLQGDLENGTWSERYSSLRSLQELDIGYRIVVSRCA
jgi:hypothetical protein